MAKLGNSRPGEVYTPEEITKLIKACGNRYPTGIRNAGLIAVLYGSGLRINEALDLVLSDLDLEQGLIRVKHGKGDKYRTCSISPDCQAVLQTWLERRKAMGFNGREPVFFLALPRETSSRHGEPDLRMPMLEPYCHD